MGYSPTKHGRASFHPLTFFDGITRAAIRVELRPGNTVAATGLIEAFWRAYEEVQRLGATVIAVRADRGFQSDDFFSLLEQLHIDYAIKISVNAQLSAWAADLVFEKIAEDGDEVIEVAEGTYRRSTWSRERRAVVVRRRLANGCIEVQVLFRAVSTPIRGCAEVPPPSCPAVPESLELLHPLRSSGPCKTVHHIIAARALHRHSGSIAEYPRRVCDAWQGGWQPWMKRGPSKFCWCIRLLSCATGSQNCSRPIPT